MPTAIDIAYETAGAGPPLVLVSGWLQPGARWRRVRDDLAADFTVVTLDNRETGATGPHPAGFTLGDLAADVVGVVDRLGYDRFSIAGISMGGMIAQEVIGLAPGRVQAAVLLSTHGGTPGAVQPDFSVLSPDGGPPPADDDVARRAFLRTVWAGLCGPGFAAAHPDVIEEEVDLALALPTPIEGLVRQLQAIIGFDPGAEVVEAARSTTVAVGHGDADPLIPYPNGPQLAERIGAPLHTFAGAGHMLECERVADVCALIRATVAGA